LRVRFEHIVQYQWFKNQTFILFLNKQDLLEAKVRSGKADISKNFPAFKGDPLQTDDVKEFIKTMYTDKASSPGETSSQERVYPHFTQATDTELITEIFKGVKRIILKKALEIYGLS